jgi:hypothetical protein
MHFKDGVFVLTKAARYHYIPLVSGWRRENLRRSGVTVEPRDISLADKVRRNPPI